LRSLARRAAKRSVWRSGRFSAEYSHRYLLPARLLSPVSVARHFR